MKRTASALLLLLAMIQCGRAQTATQLADVRVDGDVREITVLPDGSQLLSGFIAYVNGVRAESPVRVMAGGGVVATGITATGPGGVLTTATDGTWLYLGGDFDSMNGFDLPKLARVSLAGGVVDAVWRPAPDAAVTHLAVAGGGLIVAGEFTRVQGLQRRRLARVYADGSGSPVETWHCDTQETIKGLLADGGFIYVCGDFGAASPSIGLGGLPVDFLGRILPASGAVDSSWQPGANWEVDTMSIGGGQLYLGGSFTRVRGALQPYLARVSLANAALDAEWKPEVGNLVTAVSYSAGAVYASGNFQTVNNLPRDGFVKFKSGESVPDPDWTPSVDGIAFAMAADGAGGVWLGGRFHTGATTGGGWARVAGAAGAQPVYPARLEGRGSVDTLLSSGALTYAGGLFDSVNGLRLPGAFRMSAGSVNTSWDAHLGGPAPFVKAMLMAGSEVLMGGQFRLPDVLPGNQQILNLARVSAANGAANTGFGSNPDNAVNAILPWGAGWLIGGDFLGLRPTAVGLAINAAHLTWISQTGVPDTNFSYFPDGPVDALAAVADKAFVGGRFTRIRDSFGSTLFVRKRLFLYGGEFGESEIWNPAANGPVYSLATDGTQLFVGGDFTRVGRTTRRNLASLAISGAGGANPWRPDPGLEVDVLRVHGSHLYAGGAFFDIARQNRGKLARFTLGNLALDSAWQGRGDNGQVLCFEPDQSIEGAFLAGGSFLGWDGDTSRRTLIRLDGAAAAQPLHARYPTPVDDPLQDLTAAYFEAADGHPLPTSPGLDEDGLPCLDWQVREGFPAGIVARVQWSHDLGTWHESGAADAVAQHTIVIRAEGSDRRASVQTAKRSAESPLFLRVVLTNRITED